MKLIPEISLKLVEILGEDKINEVYEVVKSKPVSFSTLRFMLRRQKILKEIGSGKRVKDIINEYHMSKMTVYRLIKSNGKNNSIKK